MNLASELTGLVDGTKVLISFWIKMAADGAQEHILANAAGFVNMYRSAGNKLIITTTNPANTANPVSLTSSTTINIAAGWTHVCVAWDSDAAVARRQMYINGVDDSPTDASNTTGNSDYTRGSWFFGAGHANGDLLTADIAECFLDFNETLDLSVAGNIEKFIRGGKPINLGLTGEKPLGSSPLIYFRRAVGDAASTFATNLGTGGNFTITGALANSSTSPTD
jgi:hypothetical protein